MFKPVGGSMKYTLEDLLANSKLPGRRANLELLYDFRKNVSLETVKKCLLLKNHDLNNTPEEFAVMCGIVGYCEFHNENVQEVFEFLDEFAQSESWRVRESVAMAIQSMLISHEEESLEEIKKWLQKTELNKRAMIAGLCTPRLQSIEAVNSVTVKILDQLMGEVLDWIGKLSEEQKALRKALGYCWSIVIEANPIKMKSVFEMYFKLENKNIEWILKSNLKKNRLLKLDEKWVNSLMNQISKLS